ncbi:hypothetical protein BGX33_001911 [Mortierella sp. NVP41]|nr:hypothetical protein BGX33_001911 [Mortierella sp. NVP41]
MKAPHYGRWERGRGRVNVVEWNDTDNEIIAYEGLCEIVQTLPNIKSSVLTTTARQPESIALELLQDTDVLKELKSVLLDLL